MEKNENLTIEDLREAISEGDYSQIIDIAEEIDVKKIKDNNILGQLADAYAKMRMYDKEKKTLELAYENTNAGRNLAYRLCLAAVKTKQFDDAMEYYEDFVEMAPRDTGRYILKYKMAKAKGASTEILIDILEEYVNIDMEEKWAYELARLYHMIGDEEKCIDMCDEVSLWFAEGVYVLKALELKKMYHPLTASQQLKYEQAKKQMQENNAPKEETKVETESVKEDEAEEVKENNQTSDTLKFEDEEVWFNEEDEEKEIEETPIFPEIEIKPDDPNRFNTIDMQKVIAEGMQEVVLEFDEEEVVEADEEITEETAEEATQEEIEEPVFNDLNDVSAFLKELQERGVLKAETVNQAVYIIEGQETSSIENEEEPEKQEETLEENKQIEEQPIEETIEEVNDRESIDNAPIDVLGATKEIITGQTKTPVDILTQPTHVLPSAEEVAKAAKEEGENLEAEQNQVPVLDLSFSEVAPPADVQVSEELDKPLEAQEEIVSDEVKLTEAELDAFKNYVNVEGFDSNIKEVLRDLINNYEPNGKSENGNVMILGNEKTGKTTLAIEIIKLVNKKRGRRDRRLAKVDANALNKRGFRNALNKLLGSDLIIENANVLGVMTISEIIDVCGMFTDDMIIVLEGDADGMDILIKNAPRISEVFNHVVRIKEYDIKEWVEYGKKYALDQGYTMDELANLAFFKVIDDFYGANKGISQGDIEDIINAAISRAGKFGRKLFGSKKDQNGYAILVEKDFNI